MNTAEASSTLAERMGTTVHVSALRISLRRLMMKYPSATADSLEDWLLDVANCRGARIVVRDPPAPTEFVPPPSAELSQEELVVAICMLQGDDRPQLLRLAAQLISRSELDLTTLSRVATRERVGRVFKSMAEAALKVDPTHPAWLHLAGAFAAAAPLRDVVIHWSRLAEPIMDKGRVNASAWRLVA
jgi:hypothetical protein